jgi:hypothetical protein
MRRRNQPASVGTVVGTFVKSWSQIKKAYPGRPADGWRFDVSPPCHGSHTGRYAILQAHSPRGYPNSEDYILLVRKPCEAFRPAFMVHVPFDEEPPLLLDYARQPEVAVVYQGFTLAWTDNGGQPIRTPPDKPEGLFKLHRFGSHWISRVEVKGEHMYVAMGAGRDCFRRLAEPDPFVGNDGRMWRFRLDGSSDAAELVEPPVFCFEPAGKEDLPVQGGAKFLVRADGHIPWVEILPDDFIKQLQEARIDFFGGTGARSFLP